MLEAAVQPAGLSLERTEARHCEESSTEAEISRDVSRGNVSRFGLSNQLSSSSSGGFSDLLSDFEKNLFLMSKNLMEGFELVPAQAFK